MIFLFFLLFVPYSLLADTTLSVQTFNMLASPFSNNWPSRKKSILNFIKENHSDINVFQEVWHEEYSQKIEEVSRLIGTNSIVYDQLEEQQKRSGLVTLSKGPISSAELYPFPSSNFYDELHSVFDVNKGFGSAYINHPKDSSISFWLVNLHLHHLTQFARLRQIIFYFQWFLNEKVFEKPIISAGDYNFQPNSLEFEIMRILFRFDEPQAHLGLEYQCTLCEENDHFFTYTLKRMFRMDYEKTLDYIFFKSSSSVELIPKSFKVSPKAYKGVFLSDHYGVKANIEFNKIYEPRQISKEELSRRVQSFSNTLYKIEKNFPEAFYTNSFLQSLYLQLEDPDSLLIQHLSIH